MLHCLHNELYHDFNTVSLEIIWTNIIEEECILQCFVSFDTISAL